MQFKVTDSRPEAIQKNPIGQAIQRTKVIAQNNKQNNLKEAITIINGLQKAGSFYSPAELTMATGDLALLCEKKPAILGCTPTSIATVILQSVKAGLSLITTPPQAHAVIYGREISFQPEYRGLLKLLYENTNIYKIDPHIVMHKDIFKFGLEEVEFEMKVFERAINSHKDYKGILLVSHRKDDSKTYHFSASDEIEKRRDVAQQKNIWNSWYNEMAIKTAIKQMMKTIQIHTSPQLASALEWDSWGEVGTATITENGAIIQKKLPRKVEAREVKELASQIRKKV